MTVIQRLLGSVLAFMALQAFGGGIYGLLGAEGVPREWLEGSPFADYVVPSVILVVAVGGSCMLAAIAVFASWPHAITWATCAGAILLGWITAQVAIIGYVSWLQPTVATVAATILTLARRLQHATTRDITTPTRTA